MLKSWSLSSELNTTTTTVPSSFIKATFSRTPSGISLSILTAPLSINLDVYPKMKNSTLKVGSVLP